MTPYARDAAWARPHTAWLVEWLQQQGWAIQSCEGSDADLRRCGDLVDAAGNLFSVRIRDAKYLRQYGKEFTIRAWRDGTRTEIDKLQELGSAVGMFYGFAAAEPGRGLTHCTYVDFEILRQHLVKNPVAPHRIRVNVEDPTGLYPFVKAWLPPGCCVELLPEPR